MKYLVNICIHPKNTGQKQDGSGKVDLKSLSYSIGSFDFFLSRVHLYTLNKGIHHKYKKVHCILRGTVMRFLKIFYIYYTIKLLIANNKVYIFLLHKFYNQVILIKLKYMYWFLLHLLEKKQLLLISLKNFIQIWTYM